MIESSGIVSVFVFSTSQDILVEREVLSRRVFPCLRSLCDGQGLTLVICGDTTARLRKEGSLSLDLLKEIQRTRPFFIGLLGEQYGIVPEELPGEQMREESLLAAQHGCSINELIIVLGVLENPEMVGRAFFYFSDPEHIRRPSASTNSSDNCSESPEVIAKLRILKERIRNSGFPVRENYPDPDALSEWILKDLSDAIKNFYPVTGQPRYVKWPFDKKKTMADLSTHTLDLERTRLEEEERRILVRLQRVEEEKKRLFLQGTKESSQRQKVVIARKIKEIDEQGKELDSRASMISKQLRAVNRFTSVHRNKMKLQEKGVWSVISDMSTEELDTVLTKGIVDGTIENEKILSLLDIIETDPRITRELDEDEDVLKLVEKMEQASESGEITEKYSKTADVLDAKDKDIEAKKLHRFGDESLGTHTHLASKLIQEAKQPLIMECPPRMVTPSDVNVAVNGPTASGYDARCAHCGQQIRVSWKACAFCGAKSGMSAEELDGSLTQEVVRETVERDKAQALLEVIETDPRAVRELDEDENVLRLEEEAAEVETTGKDTQNSPLLPQWEDISGALMVGKGDDVQADYDSHSKYDSYTAYTSSHSESFWGISDVLDAKDKAIEKKSHCLDGKNPVTPNLVVDKVHFSVTNPATVLPGDCFVLDVWAHLEEQRASVVERARQSSVGQEVSIRSKGPTRVSRGVVLSVNVNIEGLTIEDPEDTILWEGEVGNASFAVSVPKEFQEGPRQGQALIYVNGLRLARVNFVVSVGRLAPERQTLASHEERFHKAFASYASKDRDEVLARVQGMNIAAPHMDIFIDVLSLRSGQDWKSELERVIPASDVFYLFWSENALESEWVELEWRCALKARGIDFIDPVPLISPEKAPPPKELASKHFNDWTLAFIRGQGATKNPRPASS